MALFNWRFRKQFFYFTIVLGVVAILVFLIIWFNRTAPTCWDGEQNQNEEGVDCGGVCEIVCSASAQDLVVFWTRPLKISEGVYDVAALLNNPNTLLGSSVLKYRFKFYDANNVLINLEEGTTFINPRERFVIFGSNIKTGAKIPQRATIEFGEIIWRRVEEETPFIEAVKRDFDNFPFPRLVTEIKNNSIFDVRNVFLTAVLFDENGNSMAASRTSIDFMKAESTGRAVFTWPESFSQFPASSEIYIRIRLVP